MPTNTTRDDDTGGRGLGRRPLLRRIVACGGSLVGLALGQPATAQPTTTRPQDIGARPLSATTRAASEWTQLAKLIPDDEDDVNVFGVSIALEGSTALIGSTWAAYVFTESDGNWAQQAKLTADDQDDLDAFGQAVAFDGTTALIGAPHDNDPNGFRAGSAYIFIRPDGKWTQQTKLVADDGTNGDRFASSVAVDGDTALIGAPGGEDSGKAYVFMESDGEWTQQANFTHADPDRGDEFGSSVALDGDTAVIGARLSRPAGEAYVFTRSDGEWTQQARLTPADRVRGDEFGSSVALDGDTAVIGAERDEDHTGRKTGAAYVFTYSNGTWTQQAKLTADDGDEHDMFGASAVIDGRTILVGASADNDPNGQNAGSAYVFTCAGGEWTQQTKLTADDGDEVDNFGEGAALERNTAIVGAAFDEDPLGYSAGSAYVYWKDQKEARHEVVLDIHPGIQLSLSALRVKLRTLYDKLVILFIVLLLQPNTRQKEGRDIALINPDRTGTVPVAILHTDSYDPTTEVDVRSLRFGAPAVVDNGRGATPVHGGSHIDVNGDGADDLLLYFPVADTGFEPRDEAGKLVGETTDGDPIVGTEPVKIMER